jgi:FixJ family two-component response regulator
LGERSREVRTYRVALCEIRRAIAAQIQNRIPPRSPALSPRQRFILDGILAGQASKAMAYDLGISVKSVETHRRRVMDKFGAESLAELILKCLPRYEHGEATDLAMPTRSQPPI